MRTSYATRRPERWEREAEATARAAEREARKRVEREARLRPKVKETVAAKGAWKKASDVVRAVVPESTFLIWFEPLRVLGEAEGALCIAAPSGIRAWVERRYPTILGNAVRETSDYRGVFLITDAGREEGDGCL